MTPSTPASTDVGALAALEQIEKIIADRERLLLVPDIKAIKQIWKIARDAIDRKSAPKETRGDEPVAPESSLPTYGSLPWEQLGRDVNEATMGQRIDFRFASGYPGHDMTLINFNSLARIVDKYRRAAPQQSPRLERDKLLIDQRLTVFAENAAKRIARAEQLDNVSAKEIYRTIIEAMVSGCIALQTAQDADALLSPDTTVVSSTNHCAPESAEPAEVASRPASDLCAGAVNPGWDACPKCGATMDDECAFSSKSLGEGS